MWIRICDGGMSVDRIGFHQSFVDATRVNIPVYTSLFYGFIIAGSTPRRYDGYGARGREVKGSAKNTLVDTRSGSP
jgi:hypothetical protein